MESNVFVLEAAICDAPEVPEAGQAGQERSWNRAERRSKGLEEEEGDTGKDQAKGCVDNVVEMHVGWFSMSQSRSLLQSPKLVLSTAAVATDGLIPCCIEVRLTEAST